MSYQTAVSKGKEPEIMCVCQNKYRRWEEIRYLVEEANGMVIEPLQYNSRRSKRSLGGDACLIGIRAADVALPKRDQYVLGDDVDVNACGLVLLMRTPVQGNERGKRFNTYIPTTILEHKKKAQHRAARHFANSL